MPKEMLAASYHLQTEPGHGNTRKEMVESASWLFYPTRSSHLGMSFNLGRVSNIMLIVFGTEGVAYRKGVGRIHKDAVHAEDVANLENKALVLG